MKKNRLPLLARAARRVLSWYDFAEPFNAAGGRKRRPPRIEYKGEESEQLTPRRRLQGVDLARNMVRNDSQTRGLVRQIRSNVVGDFGKLIFSESGPWFDAARTVFRDWSRHADYIDGASWRETLQLVAYAIAMEGDCVVLDDEGKMKGSALVLEFPDRTALDTYLKNEPYVVEGVWQKIEIETMNVVLVNGEKVS